jgi:hypothetical protein
MDLVPLDIMLVVEAFGKVWCWSEEVDWSGRTYPRHVSCHNLSWGIISASGLRIGWTKTPFRSSQQELRNSATKLSIWGCLSRCFICAIMSHYDLHPNIHQRSWNPLVYNPTTIMQDLMKWILFKVEGWKYKLNDHQHCSVFIDNNVLCVIRNIYLYQWYGNIICDVNYWID